MTGWNSEIHVAQFFRKKGYKKLFHRFNCGICELDLVMQSPEGHIEIVEVKSIKSPQFETSYFRRGQKKRLQNAAVYLANKWQKEVGLSLALVSPDGDIELLPVD